MVCPALLILLINLAVFQTTNSFTKLGTKEFREVIKGPAFIDKTNFIEYFWRKYSHVLITAPSRFGKSVILDMLKTFFQIKVDQKGNPEARNLTENYNLFVRNKLDIVDDRDFFQDNFGNYPVIFLDFSPIKTKSYEIFLKGLQSVVLKAFLEHQYLKFNEELSQKYSSVLDLLKNNVLTEKNINAALETLAGFLMYYHRIECLLFIDGNDAPITKALMEKNLSKDDFLKIEDTLTSVIDLLVDNCEFIMKTLILAELRIGTPILPKASKLKIKNVFVDDSLWKYFGFTEEDIQKLLPGLNVDDQRKFKFYYDGYQTPMPDESVFCPVSVLKFMSCRRFESYWAQGQQFELETPLLKNYESNLKIENFIFGIKSVIYIYRTLKIQELLVLRDIVFGRNVTVDLRISDIVMELLVERGYFRIGHSWSTSVWKIRVPNFEVEDTLLKNLYKLDFLMKRYPVSQELRNIYADAVNQLGKNRKTFSYLLNIICLLFETMDFNPPNEAAVKTPLAGYCLVSDLFKNKWVQLGKSGNKRADLILKKDDEQTTVIFDYKFQQSTDVTPLSELLERECYKDFTDSKNVILIEINLTSGSTFSLTYLNNSYDLSNAKTLYQKLKLKPLRRKKKN